MTVENCLRLAKEWAEDLMFEGKLVQKADPAKSQFYLNRAKHKVVKYQKYVGKKIDGFKLVSATAKPKPEPKPKEDGKKPKR